MKPKCGSEQHTPTNRMANKEIRLRQEIYRSDVEKMTEWMDDDEVVAYLNEEQNVNATLRRSLRHSSLPIFSAQFNRNGSFYLITHPDLGPIGFLRLVPKAEGAEIVIVIGDRSQWGKGYGFAAIQKGLNLAFFDWREDRVIAKIRKDNQRSIHVFKKAGFTREKELNAEMKFSLTIDEYL